MAEPEASQAVNDLARAVDQFSDWRWRLNNLYWITDKDGRRVKFQMNWAQEALFDGMHYQNIILKARQLGFTTFIQIFMLDACVWNSNVRAGTIAHTLTDAQAIFRDKIKYPYDQLPEGIRAAVPTIKDSATDLMLANNSSVRVGTSLRSGTLQYLHVSEYGKICAKYPDKAREVRTGALNTVQAGQIVFVESTAEGQEGHFYDLSEAAQAKSRMKAILSPLDFKFHFYPWWKSPDYQLDPTYVGITASHARYFGELETKYGIRLTDAQKAWYVKKAETQLSDMKREYPSTPEEAFEASVEGAYYGEQMAVAELQGRVGMFKALPGYPVHTWWDIGVGDYTSIWFGQIILDRLRLVAYYQNTGEGMPFYVKVMNGLADARGWQWGRDFFPHDVRVKEWGTGRTRIEQLIDAGRRAVRVPLSSLDDGINAVRMTLPSCEFDAEDCADGLKALKAYRKEWDDEHGIWMDKPRHDAASHGADAFRALAMSWREVPSETVPAPPPPEPENGTMQVRIPGLGEGRREEGWI